MAADSAVKQAANTGKGVLRSIWNRVNPFRKDGLWKSAAFTIITGTILVGAAWAFAPQAMAAIPTLTVPSGAGAGKALAVMTKNAGNHVLEAGKLALAKTGDIITTTDWSELGHKISDFGSQLTGDASAGVQVPATATPAAKTVIVPPPSGPVPIQDYSGAEELVLS